MENPHLCGFFTLMNTAFSSIHTITASAVCAGINHVLRSEPWAMTQLVKHAGKSILLQLPFRDLACEITPVGLLHVLKELDSPSLTLEVSAKALNELAGSPASLREQAFKAVKITGDADLAQLIGRLAGQLRWEYEEDLARIIGDAPAHFAVRQGKKFISATQSAASDLLSNIVEYLSEEKKVLLHQRDLVSRKTEVNDLRDAVDRLEKRIQLLEQKAK
jgi:ubiquinone biosynthesis accessory factor UbiJ